MQLVALVGKTKRDFIQPLPTTCARIVRLCRSFDRMGDKNSLERSKGHEKTTKTIIIDNLDNSGETLIWSRIRCALRINKNNMTIFVFAQMNAIPCIGEQDKRLDENKYFWFALHATSCTPEQNKV